MLTLLFLAAAARADITLKTGDALNSSSFTGMTNWSDGLAPHTGTNYLVAVQFLRTPPDANNYTFAAGGSSLTITNGGGMIYKGTASANTYTFKPLILNNGGLVRSGAGSGNTMILAGTISVLGTSVASQILADQSPYTINSAISGPGSLLFSGGFTTTLNGTNSSTGNTSVSGTVTLGISGELIFTIAGSGTNNSISGTGSATFNGSFGFDLTAASTNIGDSWTVASATTVTYGTTFSVNGFARLGGGNGPGTWLAATNGAFYSFITSGGVLQVVASTNPVVPAFVPVAAAPIEADLLSSYAASYASSVGGQDNAEVIIANTVAGSNKIQDQGGTGARMRVAGYYQSVNDVTGQTSTGGIVNWLAANDSHLSDVVAQGVTVGADLVVYICNNTDSSTIAGVSQQPGFYSSLNPGAVFAPVFAHETGGHAYGRAHADGVPSPVTIMLHNYCPGGGAAPPYFYSNPKIWFNGVQLLGPGSANNCGQGSPVNGGDNSSLSAQAVADRRARIVAGPNLNNVILHWMFTNAPGLTPAGTTNFDLVSGAPAVVRGNGAFYTGTTLRIPGGTTGNVPMSTMSAYVDLPNGIVSSQTNLTIEIWATPLSAPSWARICDFGRAAQAGDGLGAPGEYTGATNDPAPGTTQSQDVIFLSAAIGTTNSQQRFEAELGGVATNIDSALATTAGVPHHYAITFTDGAGAYSTNGGRWQWFRDGDAVTYLDVSNHLAAMQDVNNWLGRSQWSADSLANNDYAEVRISNAAMTRGQILANYLLGPNYGSGSTVMLTNNDAGGASSFNAAGQWGNGAPPAGANSYETFDFSLRTPATASFYTFAGNALAVSGGSLLWEGTGSSTITVTNLGLNGGTVRNAGSGTCTLAGNLLSTNSGGVINAVNGGVTLAANLNGGGPLTFLGGTTTLTGSNAAFAGKLFIGDGMAGTLAVDSQARLGASPTNFVPNQLDLNRGTLKTTATFSLNDTNRGILLDISGGTLDVAPGTTLTLAGTLSSPSAPVNSSGVPYNVVAGALTKADSGTLILGSPTNTFIGTLYVDSGSTSANDGVVKVVNNQVLAAAHSPIFIQNNNSGSSTLQLDGTSGNITLPQQIALSGRSSSVAALDNVAGTNTISGGISLNVGGGNYWIQSDAGLLTLGGTISSAATGTRTLTLQGAGGLNITGVVANGGATVNVTKAGTGTLTLSGANTFGGTNRIGGGSEVLANGSALQNCFVEMNAADSGTLSFGALTSALFGALDGSRALALTNAGGAAVTLTVGNNNLDAGYDGVLGGTGSLVKTGSGAFTLTGANIYTGTTTVAAGQLLVNGSTASGQVTVANVGTLGGTGTINGPVTVQSGGTLAPGAGIGSLAIRNSLALSAGSTSLMEISKTGGATTNDAVNVLTSVSYGGTLLVTNIGAGTLAAGDSFKLFSAAGYSGGFSQSILPALGTGLGWNTNGLTNGVLSIVTTVRPQFTSIVPLSDGNFQFNGSGAAGVTYELDAATNLSSPVSWSFVTNAVADQSGLFQLSDLQATNFPQRFYRISSSQ